MQEKKILGYVKDILEKMPADWLNLTTHRLDIYEEKLAKTQFLEQFEILFESNNSEPSALNALSTAYDYIRLGHPLSCILEWLIAQLNDQESENVISFSSSTMPILAILRKNLLDHKNTQILYTDKIPAVFNTDIIRNIYGYNFELKKIEAVTDIPKFDGSTIFISQNEPFSKFDLQPNIDFYVRIMSELGSVLLINGVQHKNYVADIQHVRRRETIAMTPLNSRTVLNAFIENTSLKNEKNNYFIDKKKVQNSLKEITGTSLTPLIASSGLSIQYAIMMGLIDDAKENHSGKAIKFIVPPNCYGGTNDQARRVAACLKNVDIVDLPVDGNHDMVHSLDAILTEIAKEDAVPFIIAEIPTNPRVEVPNLIDLQNVLSKKRVTSIGETAIDPVFILDQTFCPNVHFLGEGKTLSSMRTISYASGSKFPSGGQCTAGYCVGNTKTAALMDKIEIHLELCNNEATHHQMKILAKQLPSMNQRIVDAYKKTREFVDFIQDTLPTAKINFVSEELATQQFTPSVFSLDLPTKGNTDAEKEAYKRALNLKLINLMIGRIPHESKFCVSYGQLKGCYWTVPATSTQGTTKEGDKDYIVRASLSPELDLELHKKVFLEFVEEI